MGRLKKLVLGGVGLGIAGGAIFLGKIALRDR